MRELRVLVVMLEITVDNDDESDEVSNNVSGKVGEGDSAIVTLTNTNSPTPNFPITTTGNYNITYYST